MATPFLILLVAIPALVVLGLVIAFVLVPLAKGIGWLIVAVFRGIGWLIMHVVEYVAGTIGDVLRFIGSLLVMIVLLPFAPLNVVLGRWSAAGHYAESLKREIGVAGSCLYRALLRRPLKLLLLHGVLEGVEQRLPEAMAAAPTSDKPKRRTGQFEGYTIVGSLPGGGSGAKLYVAEPDRDKRDRIARMPERVVIKSFTLSEGSSLPQIVRESRALECAKQLGHVLDHGMDEHRFFYVMPYHPGEHLGVITRQMHGRSDGRGLDDQAMRTVMSYIDDLLQTLSHYHGGGLWHKDVKPENVIVHDGGAHLVDLGLVTPLRSAMTLTTHGTEYFRDPEMVRQALRGVKVHQVDGAKFDVYAVGAVLYFMIENTFPAHGGLSSFSKRSPESLRWIIRRAMADYNKRYATADAMLADLRAVRTAHDLMAVRPADLPSMRGDAAYDSPAPQPAVDQVFAAGSPAPPASPAAAAAPAPVSLGGPAVATSPRLRVTNWWTGAYMVEDGSAGGGEPDPSFREQAQALRWESRELKRQVRDGAMQARRAAREQIKSARARAKDLRKRASTRRHRAVAERQPSAALIVAIVMFLGLVALGALAVLQVSRQRSFAPAFVIDRGPSASGVVVSDAADPSSSVLLVVDVPNRHQPTITGQVKQIMSRHRSQGREVLLPSDDTEHDRFAALIRDWYESGGGPTGHALHEVITSKGIEGVLYVSLDDSGHGHLEMTQSMIEPVGDTILSATAASITEVAAVELPEISLLLINDHPAKLDPGVQEVVNEAVADFEDRGYVVVLDDESEAAVRPLLPTLPSDRGETSLPARFDVEMEELGYDGVLWITAGPGDGPPHTRVVIERLDVGSADAPGSS